MSRLISVFSVVFLGSFVCNLHPFFEAKKNQGPFAIVFGVGFWFPLQGVDSASFFGETTRDNTDCNGKQLGESCSWDFEKNLWLPGDSSRHPT